MKKKTNKFVSLLLALSLAFSCLSPAALAAELEEQSGAESSLSAQVSGAESVSPVCEEESDSSSGEKAEEPAPAEESQDISEVSGPQEGTSVPEEDAGESAQEDSSVPSEDEVSENPQQEQVQTIAQEGEALVSQEESTKEAEPAPAQREVVRSAQEVSEFIAENWREDYFREAVVDTKKNRVTVDGQRSSVEEAFGDDGAQEEIFASPASAQAYFEDTPFEAEAEKGGKVTVTSPYQTCRIVVTASSLEEDYGAETILEWPRYGQYVLQFADEETTQAAYETLSRHYECYVDQVFTLEESVQDTETWGAAYLGMDALKSQGSFSSAETIQVAVIDTGCQSSNSFFSGRSFSADSRNMVNGSSDYSDVQTHGTHVAGIVHTCTPANVELMILRIYDDDGKATIQTLDTALKYALEKGAEVVNVSLGKIGSKAAENHSIDEALALAKRKGVPVVCAAGNYSQDVNLTFPAGCEGTIAVSAINQKGQFASTYSDNPDDSQLGKGGSGSAYGEGVDFCAPGVGVVSAIPGGTGSKNGTSMASPHIAAAFAWLRLEDPAASVAQLYERLKGLCRDLGATGKDQYYGWGCPNLADMGAQSQEHQHQWTKEVVKPTCTEGGYTRWTCSGCSEERIVDQVGPAHSFDENGVCTQCGKQKGASFDGGLTWDYNSSTMTLTITGSAAQTLSTAPWEALYPQGVIHWVVLDRVKGLGEGMFSRYSALEGVNLGECLSEIGEGALCGCPELRSIRCSAGDFTVEENLLYDAKGTTLYLGAPAALSGQVTVKNSVTKIAPRALEGCAGMQKLILPTSLTEMGTESLKNCTGLTEIYARSSVQTLGQRACEGVTAKVSVSQGCTGWEEDKRSALGGNLTWDSYPGNLADETVWTMTVSSLSKPEYTGQARRPGVTLKSGDTVVRNFKSGGVAANHSGYFTYVYADNVEPGRNSASVTITGKGIYYGTRTAKFSIMLCPPVMLPSEQGVNGVVVHWEKRLKRSDEEAEEKEYSPITYQVLRRTGQSTTWEKLGTTQASSYTDTTVVSGQDYTYSVYCLNEKGKAISNYYNTDTSAIKYVAAPELSSVETKDDSVQLNWEKTEGASFYEVLRKDESGQWQSIGTTTDTSFTDTTPIAGTESSYTIRAVTESGSGSAVHEGVTTQFVAKPLVSSLSWEGKGVRVRWGAVTGAKKYRVFCKTGSGGWKTVGDTSQSSLLVTTSDGRTALRSGTTYAFTVRCVSAEGSKYESTYDSVGKSIVYCTTPVLSSAACEGNGVRVKWGKVTGAKKYRVYCKSGTSSWQKVGDTTATSMLVKKRDSKNALKAGVTYRFTVRCVSADGKSSQSAYNTTGKAAVFVQGTAISKLTNAKGQKLTVGWKRVSGVGGYQVQIALNSAFTSGRKTLKVQGAGKLKGTVSKLKKKKKYYVRVRSWRMVSGKVRYSGWSSVKSITIKK